MSAAADTRVRITDSAIAEAHIGAIVTYNTGDGPEYGRILRATPTQVALERLQLTDTGAFVSHPVPVCPRSRNVATYSRDIRIVRAALNVAEVAPAPVICVPEEAPAPRMALNVAEVAPAAPTDAERIVALERRVALLTEAVVSLLEMKSRGEHDALTRQEGALSLFPLRTGQTVNLWGSKATIGLPCDWQTGTSDKSVCEAAVTALQTATVKTDSLLTALGHSA